MTTIDNTPNEIKTNITPEKVTVTTTEPLIVESGKVDAKVAISIQPTTEVANTNTGSQSPTNNVLFSNGPDLVAYYNLSVTEGTPLEVSTFSINPSGTQYAQKFLDKVECGKVTLYPPSPRVDPFFDVRYDIGYGKLMGLNDSPNYQHRTNFRPGIVNCVPVWMDPDPTQRPFVLPNFPKINGHEEPDLREKRVMGWEEAVKGPLRNAWNNFPDFDEQVGYSVYGGPMFRDSTDPFVYRIGLNEIVGNNESYISASGADFERLNVDAQTVKDVFYNFKLANMRFNNNEVRDLYSFCYNEGRRDPLAFSMFVQHMKLMLYCDQVSSIYDHLENWNSGHHYFRFSANKDEALEFLRNDNSNTWVGDEEGTVGWCTQRQYQQYLAKTTELNAWAEDIDWYFVPIRYQCLQTGNLPLGVFALSLFPYPVATVLAKSYDVANVAGTDTFIRNKVYLEPLSAKLDFQGHPNICFVIVDPPGDLVTDPAQGGYRGDLFEFLLNGNDLHIDNVFEAQRGGNPHYNDLKQYLFELIIELFQDGPDAKSQIFELLAKVDNWQVSTSVMQFIAYLTTMPVTAYKSDAAINEMPNLQNVSLVPMDSCDQTARHMYLQEPSYIQRCYRILGLVRQRSQTFITSMDYLGFRRMMYGTRMSLGACLSQLLSKARNEIPTVYGTQQFPQNPVINLRRQQFLTLFESTFLESSEILRPGNLSSPGLGIMHWVYPYTHPAHTYCSLGVNRNLREYCNVEDWVVLMTNDIEVKDPYYYPKVPDSFKDKGKVVNEDNGYRIYMSGVGRKHTDDILNMINEICGRTAYKYSPILQWGFLTGDDTHDPQGEIYEPVYYTGQLCWASDPWEQGPAYTYNWCSCGGGLNTPELPPVRVMDYIYPITDLDEQRNMWYKLPPAAINNFRDYIIVRAWDSEHVHAYYDYSHAPMLPSLNKL